MTLMTRFPTSLLVAACAALLAAPAFADTLYESAPASGYSGEPGDYPMYDTRFIGAAFELAQAADVTAIGGVFTQYSFDAIFGAIVPLASLTATPAGAIDAIALGHVVFEPTGGEQSAALSVHLEPGTYGLVFGSGLWGAAGDSGLVSGGDSSGAHLFDFIGAGSPWEALSDQSGIRLVVYGTVPEPGEGALMLAGLLGLVPVLRRARRVR